MQRKLFLIDRELVEQIRENLCMQYFIVFKEFTTEKLFADSFQEKVHGRNDEWDCKDIHICSEGIYICEQGKTRESIISSHFWDSENNVDLSFQQVSNIDRYFTNGGNANIYFRNIILGSKIPDVLVIINNDGRTCDVNFI